MLKSSQPIGDDPNLWMALNLTYDFVRFSYVYIYIHVYIYDYDYIRAYIICAYHYIPTGKPWSVGKSCQVLVVNSAVDGEFFRSPSCKLVYNPSNYFTGWWFGTSILFSHILGCIHHPNWLSYFSEGLKPPTIDIVLVHKLSALVNYFSKAGKWKVT